MCTLPTDGMGKKVQVKFFTSYLVLMKIKHMLFLTLFLVSGMGTVIQVEVLLSTGTVHRASLRFGSVVIVSVALVCCGGISSLLCHVRKFIAQQYSSIPK